MVQKVKTLILSRVSAAKKTAQDISTYSLVRPANGLFYLKIYWKGKARKGGTTAIIIDLSFKVQDAKTGIDAIELVLEEAKNMDVDFDQPLETVHNDDTAKKGW